MTSQAPRPSAHGGRDGSSSGDVELLAGLWEEAPFARLPWDAPAELRELVDVVDNPRRVYAIHQASRRHHFQLIVQLWVAVFLFICSSFFSCFQSN